MKNNPNSLINKFAEIHSELVKLNKRLSNVEIAQEKTSLSVKEEVSLRNSMEKKNFQQFEQINGKFFSLRKAIEDMNENIPKQIQSIKEENEYSNKESNDAFHKSIENKLRTVDSLSQRNKQLEEELQKVKNNMQENLNQEVDILNSELKKLKLENEHQGAYISTMEKKLKNMENHLTSEINDLHKNFEALKNDVVILKNFKDTSVNNFKDITNEFIKA